MAEASSARIFRPVWRRGRVRGRNRLRVSLRKQDFRERPATAAARTRLAALLEEDVVRVISEWSAQIDVAGISRAAAVGGNIAIAEEAAGLGGLQANLGTIIRENLAEALEEGVRIGARFAPPEIAGATSVAAESFISEQAASYLARTSVASAGGITATTREGIRRVLIDGLADRLSPTDVAGEVGRLAGLTPRQATANRNFKAMLERSLVADPADMTPAIRGTIDRRVAEYRERQLHDRGRVISETEIQDALMEGEKEYYDAAVSEGAVSENALKIIWMTVMDQRVCAICAPLHGKVVGYSTSFSTNTGGGFEGERPPAHAACRCYLDYVLDEEGAIPETGRL